MDIKRVLTAVIGLPLVLLGIIFGTPQIISFVIFLIAIICMNEYLNVISKICKPIKWVGYLSTIIVFIVSIVETSISEKIIIFGIPTILLILFLHIIITDMRITFKDVAYTLLGIIYVTGFITFLSLIVTSKNGKYLLGYTLITAWTTDIFAYIAGKYFGKHHFSKVSPKKTIEGCIAGTIAALILGIVYSYILKVLEVIDLNGAQYLYIGIVTLLLSIISQIGDFTASTIKRAADSKDYGNMLPGHGGMLDRIDSLIFISPFIYMLSLIFI